MTHSGGQPHAVGDRGQRYQVTYLDSSGARKVFGWSDTMDGAEAFCQVINLHPSMSSPHALDRQAPGYNHS